MFHFHFECHLDVSKDDLMLLKEFKLREKRGGGFIFVSFRMVCQTLSVKKEFTFLYEFSCIRRQIPELRSFFCVHKTCVNKACVKKACVKGKSIYARKMRAHASKWKAVYLSLHLRDCGMHAKILKKRASGNITTISHLFTWVDKNVTVEIQLKSVYASVNEKP